MVSVEMVYGSEFGYLKASDIVKPTSYKISRYYILPFDDNKRKVVLVLKDEKSQEAHFVLNKTNAFKLADRYGQEINNWLGRDVTLSTTSVTFNGKEMKALSVV